MNIVIDLILIGIILLFTFISAKRGFVKVLVETVGFIAAIIVAFTISTPLAGATYDKIIEPPIIEAAVNAVGESAEHEAWNALPEFLMNNEFFGEEINTFTAKISENIAAGTETAVTTASQQVVRPIAVKILGLLYSVVLVLVLLVVVKFLAKLLNGVFSFSVVGSLNRTLGGILGAVKGIIVAVIFCMVITLIISFTGKPFLIFTESDINNTYIFKFFTEIISLK